jgi:hypothetical protein
MNAPETPEPLPQVDAPQSEASLKKHKFSPDVFRAVLRYKISLEVDGKEIFEVDDDALFARLRNPMQVACLADRIKQSLEFGIVEPLLASVNEWVQAQLDAKPGPNSPHG